MTVRIPDGQSSSLKGSHRNRQPLDHSNDMIEHDKAKKIDDQFAAATSETPCLRPSKQSRKGWEHTSP